MKRIMLYLATLSASAIGLAQASPEGQISKDSIANKIREIRVLNTGTVNDSIQIVSADSLDYKWNEWKTSVDTLAFKEDSTAVIINELKSNNR